MKNPDLYNLSLFVGTLLNYKQMEEKDYVKVAKVFLQFQYLLTKLVATRCYNFVESTLAEHYPSADSDHTEDLVAQVTEVEPVTSGTVAGKVRAVAENIRTVAGNDKIHEISAALFGACLSLHGSKL